MSSTAAPYGLRPAYHPSGTIRPKDGTIATGLNTNVFQYSPVQLLAAGTLGLAAAGARAIGTFLGVEFTPPDGRRRVSNFWPANQAATEIVAYYTDDPYITYMIQGNAPVPLTGMGQQYDWSANDTNAGSTVTGNSNVSLNVSSAAANAGLRVVGLVPGPDNIWGDAFTDVLVQISEHQFVADIASV